MALVVPSARPWQLGSVVGRKLMRKSGVTATTATTTCRHESTRTQPFPWRHSPEPLPRLVEGDNLSGVPVPNQKESYFQELMMGAMLRREWYELLLPRLWKESLAGDFAWAFQKGLAALLSRIFRVPIHDIDKEDDGIVLDTESLSNRTEWTEEDVEEATKFVLQLFEKKLFKLFEEVDLSKMDLLLRLKPAQYRLEHIVAINFTRDILAKDESLMEAGRNMRYAARVAKDTRDVHRRYKDLSKKKKPIELFTVIADVSIDCKETFQVKDKNTGEIISSSMGPEEVTHLVRFEAETSLGDLPRLGTWKIIDLDDALEGNVWY